MCVCICNLLLSVLPQPSFPQHRYDPGLQPLPPASTSVCITSSLLPLRAIVIDYHYIVCDVVTAASFLHIPHILLYGRPLFPLSDNSSLVSQSRLQPSTHQRTQCSPPRRPSPHIHSKRPAYHRRAQPIDQQRHPQLLLQYFHQELEHSRQRLLRSSNTRLL
jgi:hypothetical protein